MKTPVQIFFKDYAAALTSFSAVNIAAFYQVPLAIYSNEGLRIVHEMSEIIAFWEQGVKPYAAQDIEKAMPRILSEEQLSQHVYISKVLWNNYDSTGTDTSEETNFYILAENDGELKINGLVLIVNS